MLVGAFVFELGLDGGDLLLDAVDLFVLGALAFPDLADVIILVVGLGLQRDAPLFQILLALHLLVDQL